MNRSKGAGAAHGEQVRSKRAARIGSVIDAFADQRVLVVGDLMLDDYRNGDVDRVSPEAPVPIVRVREERLDPGGAGNVARGVLALGARCELVAVAGTDPEGERVVECLGRLGLDAAGILRTPERPTPHKIRVAARGQQMLRIDREEEGPLTPGRSSALRDAVLERLPGQDVLVLQDYDKGVFADGLASGLIERARQLGIAVIADPKRDLARFRGATLVKPNIEEALAFVGGVAVDPESRRALVEKTQQALGGAEVVVTRGAAGMTAIDAEGHTTEVATRAAEIFDVQGAGDTSIAALALCRAAGASLVEACIVANAAAAVAVSKRGTSAVSSAELRRHWPDVLAAFEETT